MIFKQIDKVLNGEKTQTRRVLENDCYDTYPDSTCILEIYKEGKHGLRLAYEVGKTHSIQPGRGQKAIVGRRVKITALRVERLQNISEQDAIAEGCKTSQTDFVNTTVLIAPRVVYKYLWESINTRKGTRWEDNPLVAVITFEVVNS